ncbi:MAG TPA: SAM-dependent methyltransferase, partial [Flavisolibacter sp.]|nr:SAM-dependent methyltransferase [Flavisolibacter sp.]
MNALVYLIPTVLHEGITECLPAYLLDAVKQCDLFFVENERTARRQLKLSWKEMVIDNYGWVNMQKVTDEVAGLFRQAIQENKTIG